MKPGRIIFLILFVGALSWGYSRSMQPIVKYDVVQQSDAACAGVSAKSYAAFSYADQLYATASAPNAFVKIQGVYRSPHDGALEVAVFERDLEPGEPCGWSTIRIKQPPSRWPDEIVFRDIVGNALARQPIVDAGAPPQ